MFSGLKSTYSLIYIRALKLFSSLEPRKVFPLNLRTKKKKKKKSLALLLKINSQFSLSLTIIIHKRQVTILGLMKCAQINTELRIILNSLL
jgi:hypothetical protein